MTALAGTRPEAGLRDTLRDLADAQKGAAGAPAYSRFVNRPLGRLFAALAFHAGLTPNTVTAVSAAWTAVGIVLLAVGPLGWATGAAVTGCLVVGYALDAADGQLARLRGGGSPAGEWLDHVVDSAKIASIHLAVVLGLSRVDDLARGWLLVPLAFSVVAVVHFSATLLNEALRARHGVVTRAARTTTRPSVVRSLLVAPTDYGVLCLVFVLLGAPSVFLGAYALLAVGTAAYVLLALGRWYREMGALPR